MTIFDQNLIKNLDQSLTKLADLGRPKSSFLTQTESPESKLVTWGGRLRIQAQDWGQSDPGFTKPDQKNFKNRPIFENPRNLQILKS